VVKKLADLKWMLIDAHTAMLKASQNKNDCLFIPLLFVWLIFLPLLAILWQVMQF